MTKAKPPTSRSDSTEIAPAVRFVDFSVRAWREGSYVQVMAHATPAGAMRQPAAVKIGKFVAGDESHLRSILTPTIIRRAEAMYDALKPRTVIY